MSCPPQVQLNHEVALVKGGKVLRVLDGYASQGVYPNIDRIEPHCCSTKGPASVKLSGVNLRSPNNVIVARSQGSPSTVVRSFEDFARVHFGTFTV